MMNLSLHEIQEKFFIHARIVSHDFATSPVFCCPSCASGVLPCPFFNIVFSSHLLSTTSFSFHSASQNDLFLKCGQTTCFHFLTIVRGLSYSLVAAWIFL